MNFTDHVQNINKHLASDYIRRRINYLRGKKIMFDRDLAALYGIPTKRINEIVKRNHDRFLAEFMFKLNAQEVKILSRSHFQTLIPRRGKNIKYPPYAFTEQGIAMLSTIFRRVNVAVINTEIIKIFAELGKNSTSLSFENKRGRLLSPPR